ncbi:hypothetical protein [Mammaliicoccus sciuri]|uniref:hypothetical protein n=1 Tax=Mammaliicoccus sciuri TaxID=1296 RepID=UPI0034DD56E4
MLKIKRLSRELRDEIIKEVDFQFEKAMRECTTFGDLLLYRPDEFDSNNFLSDEINREIRKRYRTKVQMFINKNSIKH